MSDAQIISITVVDALALPSWQPAAGLLKVIGTNSIESVAPYNNASWATEGPKYDRVSAVKEIGINWATATYSPLVGNFGAYILGAGGHNTYYGNERYVLHLDDVTWRRYGPWGPGDPKAIANDGGLLGIHDNQLAYDKTHNLAGGTTPPFIFDQDNNELGGTTQILVPHEYDLRVWLPPSMGGGTAGSDMYVCEIYGHETSSGKRAHRWDIAAGIAAGVGTFGVAPGVGWVRAGTAAIGVATGTAVVDEAAKKVYAMTNGPGATIISNVLVLDFNGSPGAGVPSEIFQSSWGANHLTIQSQAVSEFWAGPNGTDRWMVQVGTEVHSIPSPPLEWRPGFRLYDLNSIDAGVGLFYDIPLEQMPGCPAVVSSQSICHCPDLNAANGGVFFIKDTVWSNNQYIYKVTPPPRPGGMTLATWLTQQWPWTAESMLDSVGQPMQGDNENVGVDFTSNGWYKRLRYATKARTILLNTRSDANQKLYAYTPQGL